MGLNIELLESSFKLVAPKGEALVTRFYERLFKKYPAVKPLFKKTSIKEQKKKLLASLVLVIQNLRHPDKLTPVLQDMGARHVGYGAKPLTTMRSEKIYWPSSVKSPDRHGPLRSNKPGPTHTEPSRPSCSPERSVHNLPKERNR
jgi:hypothetical protein